MLSVKRHEIKLPCVTTSNVRLIATNALKKIDQSHAAAFGSEQAEAFITLHGPELETLINRTIVNFITSKVGGKKEA